MPTWEMHPWQTHGPLRVSANGHYLEYADGAGFFWLGDTAWRLAKLVPIESAGCSSSARIQDRVPDPSLLAANTRGSGGTLSPDLRCATRDANGRWAMVYTTIGCPVRVVMSRLAAGEARAFWYNPRNGLWHVDGQEGEKGAFATGLPSGPGALDRHFYAPGSAPGPGRTYREYPEGNDWVLVLEVD